MSGSSNPDFKKVGLVVVRDGTLLLCRKNNYTSQLIMPGGQVEFGETALACLGREISEELGGVGVVSPRYIDTYVDRAAADDPKVEKWVEIQLYHGELDGNPRPTAEVVELVWFRDCSDRAELSPIIRNKILPDLLARGILRWS